MDRFLNNLRVLWRTERAIAEIKMRHVIARSGLNAAAGLLAVVGLLMFEVAGFYALREYWNTVVAALILGAVNFAIAGILVLIANSRKPGRELELANEIHDSTMQALQTDARLLQADIAAFGQALRHPLDSALPSLIIPLATMLVNFLKKPKGEGK
ncbi:MAG: phage holin family protein [Pseudomonadota bacterium]